MPLHLVCLQPNPPRGVVRALLDAHAGAARSRDHDGNLPIYYVCAEGCEDVEVLEMLIDCGGGSSTMLQQKDGGPGTKDPLRHHRE